MSGAVGLGLIYLVQIAFSIGIIVGSPRVSGIPDKVERLRLMAIVAGFIPCIGISLVIQIIYFGLYRSRLASHKREQTKAQESLVTSDFETTPGPQSATESRESSPNPFDEPPETMSGPDL